MDAYGQSHVVVHHKGKAGARKKDQMVPYNQNLMSPLYQDQTGAYNQGQADEYDLSHVVPYHRDHANAWDQDRMAVWNENRMSAFNLNPIGTHHRGQTVAHNPGFVDTYGQDQIDTYHQSEIDSHQLPYMNPQFTGGIEDITKSFKFPKSIRTRQNQSPDRDQVHDGSHSAASYHRAIGNTNAHKNSLVPDTSRLYRMKNHKNPRSKSQQKE